MKKLIIAGLFAVVFTGCKSQRESRLDNVDNQINLIKFRLNKIDEIQLEESELILKEARAIYKLNNKCNVKE